MPDSNEKLLLIDTCGETAGVALSVGPEVVVAEDLARGSASAEIVAAVRRLLSVLGWRVGELGAVGVVTGPGSFTGMRAGLATAKGLCEAAELRMVPVSRLEVLADAASLREGLAVLDAGRGELYVRDGASGREWLCSMSAFEEIVGGRAVVAETRLAGRFAQCQPEVISLHVGDAVGAVLRGLRLGGIDVSLADANYVRNESDIYRKTADVLKAGR